MQLCDLRGVPLVFLQNNSSSTAYDDNYKVIKERSKFIQCQATARYENYKLKYAAFVYKLSVTSLGGRMVSIVAWQS